jgi:hypothetical protein
MLKIFAGSAVLVAFSVSTADAQGYYSNGRYNFYYAGRNHSVPAYNRPAVPQPGDRGYVWGAQPYMPRYDNYFNQRYNRLPPGSINWPAIDSLARFGNSARNCPEGGCFNLPSQGRRLMYDAMRMPMPPRIPLPQVAQ